MTNFWIFPVKDSRVGQNKITGIEIYNQRMSDKYWGIGKNAQNRRKLMRGDLVAFYLAGRGGQSFLGTCKLESEYRVLRGQERKKLVHGAFFTATQGVKLTEIDKWSQPLPIRPLIGSLGFVRNKREWGSYLQGTIRRVSEEDYDAIVSLRESDEIKRISNVPATLTETSRFTTAKRRGRDRAFRKEVKERSRFRCAVCRKTRFTRSGYPEVESCHIYPKERNGKDDLRNGIALCKLHHWAFENGLFSINDDYSIVIEDRIRNDGNYREIVLFENKKIELPSNYRPHPIYLRAHRELHNFK